MDLQHCCVRGGNAELAEIVPVGADKSSLATLKYMVFQWLADMARRNRFPLIELPLSSVNRLEEFCVHGTPPKLEGFPQIVVGLVRGGALPRDLHQPARPLQHYQPQDRQPHP